MNNTNRHKVDSTVLIFTLLKKNYSKDRIAKKGKIKKQQNVFGNNLTKRRNKRKILKN